MVKEMTPAEKPHPSRLLLTLDMTGTFIFALEGALAAVEGDLDLFGLLVLSFATALGGGIIRDLLIGAIPPGSIRDWRLGRSPSSGARSFSFSIISFNKFRTHSFSAWTLRAWPFSPFPARAKHWPMASTRLSRFSWAALRV